jgi:hypothetical protein
VAEGRETTLAVASVDGLCRFAEIVDAATARGPEARAVLDRILHASGHVFRRPFWIHGTTRESERFLVQLNDALVEDPFPFEALYLFDDGAVIAQTQ